MTSMPASSRRLSSLSFSPHWTNILAVSTVLIYFLSSCCASVIVPGAAPNAADLVIRTILPRQVDNRTLLECLEAVPPVVSPAAQQAPCTQTLMVYSFGNSYGQPFAAQYEPPQCEFNRVTINFTATSAGRQFDRLAVMYLGDVEVWRTSTAEPVINGIIWTYIKDMSHYLSLWKKPQTLVFDLGNIVNDIYTGPFNTTLTATFFNGPKSMNPADEIIPLSRRLSNKRMASDFKVPEVPAINSFSVPKTVQRAIFSISANGQSEEEFWWSNVPDPVKNTFFNSTLLARSPFREVQLEIDGKLAGVVWPFPVVFTGGIVPSFWRPLAGIDAFDLREDEIDVTPWLPVLADGNNHTYEILVRGLADDGAGNAVLAPVTNYWVVTGKLFLWYDREGSSISGSPPTILATPPTFLVTNKVTQFGNGTNDTLTYDVVAQRRFTVVNNITTSDGRKQVSWTQTLGYSNTGSINANGNNQSNSMVISGTEVSSSGYSRVFMYPHEVVQSIVSNPVTQALALEGRINRGKTVQITGNSVFPSPLEAFATEGPFASSLVTNHQNGSANLFRDPTKNISKATGTTQQDLVVKGFRTARADSPQMPIGDSEALLYTRSLLAANNSIVFDSARGGARILEIALPQSAGDMDFAINPYLGKFRSGQKGDMV